MKEIEVLVIGGGPAGLCAASAAASMGAKALICERNQSLGGQLMIQTGKFFGNKHAGLRGFQIGAELLSEIASYPQIEVWNGTTVLGIYEDGIVTCLHQGEHQKIKPAQIVIATGASENFLSFPGNDLPGVYAAGAAETLVHAGVKPAERVLMVGAGNIGLTVSYQLKQSGVEVAAVIEVMPKIGGYLVHASKLQRCGIPIRTSTTIAEAYGDGKVEGARIVQLDENRQVIPGSEEDIACDAICLSVGLSPLAELCWLAGCKMAYIRELGGCVPLVDQTMQTTVAGVYAAGDVSGLEEATTAMLEGRLAGVSAAAALGYSVDQAAALQANYREELKALRSGPMSEKIRTGLEKMAAKRGAVVC